MGIAEGIAHTEPISRRQVSVMAVAQAMRVAATEKALVVQHV